MKKLILIGMVMVASLMLVGCGNQKAFAGQASGFGVVAESCDGDDVCEMLNAGISGIATVGDTLKADTVTARVVGTGELNANTITLRTNTITLRNGSISFFQAMKAGECRSVSNQQNGTGAAIVRCDRDELAISGGGWCDTGNGQRAAISLLTSYGPRYNLMPPRSLGWEIRCVEYNASAVVEALCCK